MEDKEIDAAFTESVQKDMLVRHNKKDHNEEHGLEAGNESDLGRRHISMRSHDVQQREAYDHTAEAFEFQPEELQEGQQVTKSNKDALSRTKYKDQKKSKAQQQQRSAKNSGHTQGTSSKKRKLQDAGDVDNKQRGTGQQRPTQRSKSQQSKRWRGNGEDGGSGAHQRLPHSLAHSKLQEQKQQQVQTSNRVHRPQEESDAIFNEIHDAFKPAQTPEPEPESMEKIFDLFADADA